MFWSKLYKSNWNCTRNFAFPVFISPIHGIEYEWKSSLWIRIFQRATQRGRILLTDNIQSGAAVVSTITRSSYWQKFQKLSLNCIIYSLFHTRIDCYWNLKTVFAVLRISVSRRMVRLWNFVVECTSLDCRTCDVSVKSRLQHPPGNPLPGHLTFLKIKPKCRKWR